MSTVARIVADAEEAARVELFDAAEHTARVLLARLNAEPLSRATQSFLARLMMLHAARVLRDEAELGRALNDGEKWQLFLGLLPEFVPVRAVDAVRKVIRQEVHH